MNVFELLILVILTGLLFLFGRFLSQHLGRAGWLVFVVPAGLFWLFFAYGIVRSTFLQIKYSLRNRPVCQAGKCASQLYVLVKLKSYGALFRCRCGDLYLASASGDSFSRVLPDNSLQTYMVKNSAGNWEPAADR
ncbi:MAG: hypothetical protein WA853_20010 [Candidatus Acidiferrum sp.]